MRKQRWSIKKQLAVQDGFLIIGLLMALMQGMVGTGVLPVAAWARSLPGGDTVVNIMLVRQLVQSLLVVGLVLLFLWLRGATLEQIGVRPCRRPHWLLWAVLLGMAMFVFLLASGMALARLFPQWIQPQAATAVVTQAQGLWDTIAVLMMVSVLAPISEELLFRGYVYHSMRVHKSAAVSVMVTSLLFACLHGDLLRMVPFTLAGICLNVVSIRFASIWSAVVMHGVWNFMMAVLLLIT